MAEKYILPPWLSRVHFMIYQAKRDLMNILSCGLVTLKISAYVLPQLNGQILHYGNTCVEEVGDASSVMLLSIRTCSHTYVHRAGRSLVYAWLTLHSHQGSSGSQKGWTPSRTFLTYDTNLYYLCTNYQLRLGDSVIYGNM